VVVTQGRRLAQAVAAAALVLIASAGAAGRQQATTGSPELAALVREYLGAGASAAAGGGLIADRMPALSLVTTRDRAAFAAGLLKRLEEIRPTDLTHDEWLTWAVLRFDLQTVAAAEACYWTTIPITPYSSPLRALPAAFGAFSLRSGPATSSYLDGLHQMPVIVAAYLAKLRSQMLRGVVLPADELRLVVPFVRTFIAAPPQSPFSVSAARVGDLPADEAAAFRARVDDTVRTVVNPALESLVAFIDGPYRARASAAVGIGQYTDGPECYRTLVRQHTGLELTPEEIHRIGLDAVEALDAGLDRVRQEAGFTGSLAEFRAYLKTDRRFFPKTSDEIGETMMAAIRRIEPRMDEFFLRKPKAPYGVKRLDESLEQSMTYGYYQVPSPADRMGYYRFNGSQPESRSLVMAAATIYHELIPGHHFQIMLRREQSGLSPYRRAAMHTAFTEGWAEYASDLAGEMGMFDDPYARAGRMAMDLFLSGRLVVDTGMNALGWTRDRAMAYMRDHTLESDVQIDTETLRYSSDMPAQALAYKLGARQIHELRRRVQAAQGGAFDIRRFHRHLLDYGSMPLGVLDEHVACYLEERHRRQ
jgi:uncharacterized protein (DUF885 family)